MNKYEQKRVMDNSCARAHTHGVDEVSGGTHIRTCCDWEVYFLLRTGMF